MFQERIIKNTLVIRSQFELYVSTFSRNDDVIAPWQPTLTLFVGTRSDSRCTWPREMIRDIPETPRLTNCVTIDVKQNKLDK